ncbi:MAG: hypothetical protein Kow0083_08940 [Methylophaga sp.]
MTAGVNQVAQGHVGNEVAHAAHTEFLKEGIIGKLDVVALDDCSGRREFAGNIVTPGNMVELLAGVGGKLSALDSGVNIDDENG